LASDARYEEVTTLILEEIAARGRCASGPEGQMQVFESWTRSGSGRLEQVLVDAGLLPQGTLAN
jgi:hypothetical protein